MKTNKELTQAVMQQIQSQAPVHARKKARKKVLITAFCALLFISPALLLLSPKAQPYSAPKNSSDYSQSSEETEIEGQN